MPRLRRACAASATRGGPSTWHGSTTIGSASTTGSPTSPRRSASLRSSASDRFSSSGLASLYEEGLAGIDGLETPRGGSGAERRGWFVYVVRLPAETDRAALIANLGGHGIASKAYMPCIHQFPHMRELGYREGQFPVAE